MKTTIFWISICLAFSLGVWLVVDASTFSLYPSDAITGRERACYTGIELWLNLTAPSSWIRPVEFLVGLLAVGVSVMWCAVLAYHRLKLSRLRTHA